MWMHRDKRRVAGAARSRWLDQKSDWTIGGENFPFVSPVPKGALSYRTICPQRHPMGRLLCDKGEEKSNWVSRFLMTWNRDDGIFAMLQGLVGPIMPGRPRNAMKTPSMQCLFYPLFCLCFLSRPLPSLFCLKCGFSYSAPPESCGSACTDTGWRGVATDLL